MKAVIPLFLLTSVAMAADILFVGTYGGTIDSLGFDVETGAIKHLSATNASAPGPTWQELSANRNYLYTVEETTQDDESKGAITSYSIGKDGKLTKVDTALGQASPVSLGISPDEHLIFTANYGSSGCSAYTTNPCNGSVTWLQDWTFKLESPGPVPDRQDAPHPHQAVFDSTGTFIVVPDLGADLIRIFRVEPLPAPPVPESHNGPKITQLDPVKTKPGTGPRHGLFYPPTGTPKYYYLVGELNNTVTAFSVEYVDSKARLEFTEIQTLSTLPADYPHDRSLPAAGEIILAPDTHDTRRIYVSNRLDEVFPDANSIASYTIDECSGRLTLQDVFSSGVNNTRHFSVHPDGKWLANAGVDSNNIAVWEMDKGSGEVVEGDKGRKFEVDQPVCLTWL